jgi:hypothetical protein
MSGLLSQPIYSNPTIWRILLNLAISITLFWGVFIIFKNYWSARQSSLQISLKVSVSYLVVMGYDLYHFILWKIYVDEFGFLISILISPILFIFLSAWFNQWRRHGL